MNEILLGEIFLEEFIKPIGVVKARLAADVDVPASRISEIVNGKRPITIDGALHLGVYCKMTFGWPSVNCCRGDLIR